MLYSKSINTIHNEMERIIMNNTLFDNQLQKLGEARNLADAQYIFDVFQAHIRYKNTMNATNEPYSLATVNVVDRNALQKMWEEARIPKERYSHNKPFDFPWSKNARALYAEGGNMARKFHLEHTLELKTIKNEALRRMQLPKENPECITDGAALLEYLEQIHQGTAFVVLTAEEHSRLPKRDVLQNEDVWTFYAQYGIVKEECISLREAGLV